MDGQNIAVAIPNSNSLEAEIAGAQIVEDGPRVCPLCNSEIRLFFINFNEKLLMCENTECVFPFGHEELQFVLDDNEFDTNIEISNRGCDSSTCSMMSSAAWQDIDRMNRAYESEDSQFDTRSDISKYFMRQKKTVKKPLHDEEEIMRNVKDINGLNMELLAIDKDDRKSIIKNEKWIKDLKVKQETSGLKLLNPNELELLKKVEPKTIGLGELKIDIEQGVGNNMSSITIAVDNKNVNK